MMYVNVLLWFLVYQLVFVCQCWLLFNLLNDVIFLLFLNMRTGCLFVCVLLYSEGV